MVTSEFQRLHIFHIFNYHQCDLESDGVLEDAKIQTGSLLDLVQPVNQCISVNIQLARGLGNIQAVFEELVDRDQSLIVKFIRRLSVEDLLDEHTAERDRQLIDQPADAQIVVRAGRCPDCCTQ